MNKTQYIVMWPNEEHPEKTFNDRLSASNYKAEHEDGKLASVLERPISTNTF